ncbi:MAG: hypothetical protein VST66_07555 [Nitrospirota bacterium]|nr:hypothetical protein [Nitrospirota bacterium]
MATATKSPHRNNLPNWTSTGTKARLWLSYWPDEEPAVHTLKLTNLIIHPFGLQFEATQPLEPETHLHIRLLLPPMTAIVAQALVTHSDPASPSASGHMVSARFTTIRDTDRRRLADFTSKRPMARLRARCRTTRRGATSHLSK